MRAIKKCFVMKVILFWVLLMCCAGGINAQSVNGKVVSAIQLIDPNDEPKLIPGIGEKVVVILYTDPDVKDVNDPLSIAVRAKKYPNEKYAAVGIANCKDTWIPNAGIRMKARQKEKEFPGSVVLLDESHLLSKSWNMGDCDEKGVVIVVGRDKRVKFYKPVSSQSESSAIINEVIKVIEKEIGM
jgi:predicted transcriptional regulator